MNPKELNISQHDEVLLDIEVVSIVDSFSLPELGFQLNNNASYCCGSSSCCASVDCV